MKLIAVLLAALATTEGSPLDMRDMVPAKCNADNCARAVTGSAKGMPTTRLQDCSSFMSVTVLPAPSTTSVFTQTTVTQIVTETTTVPYTVTAGSGSSDNTNNNASPVTGPTAPPANKRQAGGSPTTQPPTYTSPTALPAYASAPCANPSKYESACVCAGITFRTTTAATPVVTTTVTSAYTVTWTSTVTVSSAVTVAPPATTAPGTSTSTTATSTETSTTSPPRPVQTHCDGATIESQAPCKQNWRVVCNRKITDANVYKWKQVASEDECVYFADSDWRVFTADFDFTTGNCTTFLTSGPAYTENADHDIIYFVSTRGQPTSECQNH